jgi:hypothetical protein
MVAHEARTVCADSACNSHDRASLACLGWRGVVVPASGSRRAPKPASIVRVLPGVAAPPQAGNEPDAAATKGLIFVFGLNEPKPVHPSDASGPQSRWICEDRVVLW